MHAQSDYRTVWAQGSGGAIRPLETLPISNRITNAVVSYAAYLRQVGRPFDLGLRQWFVQWLC